MTVAAPAVYLLGHNLFRLRMVGSVSIKRLAAVAVTVGWGIAARDLPALTVMGGITGILYAIIALEHLLQRRTTATR